MNVRILNNTHPDDYDQIRRNTTSLLKEFNSGKNTFLTTQLQAWHSRIYLNCKSTKEQDLGAFRTTENHNLLTNYPNKNGKSTQQISNLVEQTVNRVNKFTEKLDDLEKISSPLDVDRLVQLLSFSHQSIIYIQPFESGNDKIARLLVNYLVKRYELPQIIQVHPRPNTIEYKEILSLGIKTNPFNKDQSPTVDNYFFSLLTSNLIQLN